jgi:DGQHR domain-containing protein
MKKNVKAQNQRQEFFGIEIPTTTDTKLYISAIPVSVLSKVCQVSRAEEDSMKGYQRLLSQGRLRQIADYLDEGMIIPGALILSAQAAANLEYNKGGKSLSFVLNPKSFLVIDGQHRLFGASESKSDITFPVSIMTGLTLEEEVQYFNDINGEQKGVPRTLQLEIEKFLVAEESKEKTRINLFHALNERPESPLCNRMSATKSVHGKLTHVPFKSAIEPLLDQKPLQDLDFEGKMKLLIAFLKAVEGMLIKTLKSSDKMTNAAFFQAIFGAFKMLALVTHERHHNYDEKSFKDVLAPLDNIKWDLHSGTNRMAISAFTKHIIDLVW